MEVEGSKSKKEWNDSVACCCVQAGAAAVVAVLLVRLLRGVGGVPFVPTARSCWLRVVFLAMAGAELEGV